MSSHPDLEKNAAASPPPSEGRNGAKATLSSDDEMDHREGQTSASIMLHKALRIGRVEEEGIRPVPLEERTSTRFYNIFTVWFCMNCNILP